MSEKINVKELKNLFAKIKNNNNTTNSNNVIE